MCICVHVCICVYTCSDQVGRAQVNSVCAGKVACEQGKWGVIRRAQSKWCVRRSSGVSRVIAAAWEVSGF